MTVHAGITGNKGLVAKFAIPPAATVEYDGDIKNFRITSEDKDDTDLTFAEAASGDTKDFSVVVTAIQSTEAGSFWMLLWENPGTEFTVIYGPHGNAVASETQPHFLMTLQADGKPEIGGEARRGKDRNDFEYTFEVTSGPTLDDGS